MPTGHPHTHLEPERLAEPAGHHRKIGERQRLCAETLKLLAVSVSQRRSFLPSSKVSA